MRSLFFFFQKSILNELKTQAILLTEDHHLIEFPSLLLPKGVTSGSIVNIAVSRNVPEEEKKMKEFWELQQSILTTFGTKEPEAPVVRVKNITQTSLILEWDTLVLHKAKFRSLDIYKNDKKLAQVKRKKYNERAKVINLQYQHVPSDTSFIKLSGLDVDHEVEFNIVIKTTSGEYKSNKVTARTHKMENLTGIRVAFGTFEEPEPAITELKDLLSKMGASWSDEVSVETTH